MTELKNIEELQKFLKENEDECLQMIKGYMSLDLSKSFYPNSKNKINAVAISSYGIIKAYIFI